MDRLDPHVGRGDDAHRDRVVGVRRRQPRDHHDLIHRLRFEHEVLRAVEDEPVGRLGGGGGETRQADPVTRFDEAERPGDRTLGHPAEEPGPLLGRAELTDDRCELGGRGQEGTGGDHTAELLDHDGELHRAEPEAAVGLRHRERRPAELDHLLPQRLGRGALLDDLTDERHRALAGEHRADAVAQLFLVFGELEFHWSAR